IAVNPDGTTWIAGGSVWQPKAKSTADSQIRIWKRGATEPLLILPGKLGSSRSLVFSPDGSRLVSSHLTGFTLFETGDWAPLAANGVSDDRSSYSVYGVLPCFTRDGK